VNSVQFITFGCRQNQYDTERLREDFRLSGWSLLTKEDSDCIIVNTCSVTGSAERQARNLLHRLQREHPRARIIITGCYARNKPKLKGPIEIVPHREDIIREFGLKKSEYIKRFTNHTKAFIGVQDGCDRFCSYCIVPYLRGEPRSRPKEEIEKEIMALVSSGYRVFILTGINIGRYNYHGTNLLALVQSLLEIEGVRLIGISSIEPDMLTPSLMDFIRDEKRFLRWLHISLQSGSDKILKLMGRGYTTKNEEEIIARLEEINDICIGADVICGFPGEGEKEFEETEKLLYKLPISYFHVFRFSPRRGTTAYSMKDRPKSALVKDRSRQLLSMSREKFYRFRKKFETREMEVLVENKRRKEHLVGVTRNYIKVLFNGDDSLMGKFAKVRIENVGEEGTYGQRVEGSSE